MIQPAWAVLTSTSGNLVVPTQGASVAGIAVTGTWGGSIPVQVTFDGVNWTTIYTLAANTTFALPVATALAIQILASSLTSGSATVTVTPNVGTSPLISPQQFLSPNNPIRADSSTSELNSLASGGVALSAVVLSNVPGDGAGNGFTTLKAKLSLGSVTFVAPAAVYGWLLCADDGTNYESYTTGTSTTTPPVTRSPDFVWAIYAASNAWIVDAYAAQGAPVCAKMKMCFWNMGGVTLASSGNSCNLYYTIP